MDPQAWDLSMGHKEISGEKTPFHITTHVCDKKCIEPYLENKGIVFKAQWFVRLYINTDATIIFKCNDKGNSTQK